MSAALKTGGDAKAMRTTKFPEEFNVKINMRKIERSVIMKWVKTEISKILDSDDDVVPGMIDEALKVDFPNFKKLQIDLSGFLDKDAPIFSHKLVKLCISAQNSPTKVPPELLEAKKQELLQGIHDEEGLSAVADRRLQAERNLNHGLADLRQRERDRDRRERERDHGRDRAGAGRYSDRRPPRDVRSSPQRRNGNDFRRSYPPRYADSYVPSGRRGHSRETSRNREKSYRYRSRTPPRRDRSLSRSDDGYYAPSSRRRRRYSPRSRSPPRFERRRRNSSSSPISPPRRGRQDSPPRDLLSKSDRIKDAYRLERPVSSGEGSGQSVGDVEKQSLNGDVQVSVTEKDQQNKQGDNESSQTT